MRPASRWLTVYPDSLPPEAARAAALAAAMQHLIDDLPEQVALLSENFTIIAVNRAWAEGMAELGYEGLEPGDNYEAVCEKIAATGYEPAAKALAAIRDIASGNRDYWQLVFNGRGARSSREYQIAYHRVSSGTQTYITVTRFELTEGAELRRLKDDFRKSIIESQTMERQRLARELHDSTSQLLAAVGLMLGHLKRQSPNEESLQVVEQIQELMGEAQREIRSISYLGLPPSLEKLGLANAMTALVDGFSRRTGLIGLFEIDGEATAMSAADEGAFYRVAQEALSNVQRHARATSVRVLLAFRRSANHLVISDDGVGISRDTLTRSGHAGVGIHSMRSRLAENGGRLSVQLLSPGTAIVATLGLRGTKNALFGANSTMRLADRRREEGFHPA